MLTEMVIDRRWKSGSIVEVAQTLRGTLNSSRAQIRQGLGSQIRPASLIQ